jgi:colanic acid biosynthesis glycosyl transferase WcaI
VPQDPEGAEFAVPSKVYNIMAVGRPFVTTARPGSPLAELEASSGAFLCVPPNDRRAFAAAVLKLADDRALRDRLGARGRSFVERHFAKPRVLGAFMARIETLYAGR